MSEGSVLDLVVRLGDVVLDRPALEKALGIAVDRYEAAHGGAANYAQLDPPFDSVSWSAVAEWLTNIAPQVKGLIERRQVGSGTMDLAVSFPDNLVARNMTVPARIALLAGQNLIDIEVSIYLSSHQV